MSRTTTPNPPDRPMSIEEIVRAAGTQQIDARFSMLSYLRAAALLIKQANIYEHEGNDQMAYLLLYRHANLILGELSKHPRAKEPEHRQAWSDARREVKRSLPKLEVLKPRIEKARERFDERQRARAVREATREKQGEGVGEGGLEDSMWRASLGSAGMDQAPVRLDPVQDREAAVALANGVSSRQASRSVAEGEDSGDVSASLISARRQVEQQSAPQGQRPPARTSSRPNTIKKVYTYPSVPDREKDASSAQQTFADRLPTFTSIKKRPQTPPQRPPKQQYPSPSPPPRPLKASLTTPIAPPPSTSPLSSPSAPPSSKTTNQFRTTSTLESGLPLRTVFLPSTLHGTFLSLAKPNTSRNLETCAILIGSLMQNAFFISHLLLPAQDSTSDTCEMRDETQLYAFIEAHSAASAGTGTAAAAAADPPSDELMVLGWIHTHPTQTCFLSSADLHTHLGYQLSLSESVAIVCSPSKRPPNDFGIFRLTDPPGVGAIRACQRRGLFHPHEVPVGGLGLFTDVLRDGAGGAGVWGHVVLAEGLNFEVVDLRD